MMKRTDCFWYRPWYNMGARIDQCEVADTAECECPCEESCKWYISKYKADNLVYTILQVWAD